ncbi:MAG: DinB family protein [candidate division Zixibacteria bacterium]|nr:DinB family protein [candidate division Zixibacteria bacterium]
MNNAVKPVSEILGVNDFMYRLAFVGVDEQLARRQLQPKTNSLIWLLGHIAVNRAYVGQLTGLQIEEPWGELFNKSIDQIAATALPPLTEIRGYWEQVAPKTAAHLSQLDEAALAGALPFKFPTREQNVLAGLSFMAMHESYHVGQMSSLRKHLGLESLYELAVKEMKKSRE